MYDVGILLLTVLKGHNIQIFENELMVEIYSKSLVRASGKVLLMNFS